MTRYKTFFAAIVLIAIIAWVHRREYKKDLTPIMKFIDEHDIKPIVLYSVVKKNGIDVDLNEFISAIEKRGNNKTAVKAFIRTL
jgi:hypothetical protein